MGLAHARPNNLNPGVAKKQGLLLLYEKVDLLRMCSITMGWLEVSLASQTLYLTATLGKGLVKCMHQFYSLLQNPGGTYFACIASLCRGCGFSIETIVPPLMSCQNHVSAIYCCNSSSFSTITMKLSKHVNVFVKIFFNGSVTMVTKCDL